MVELHWRLWVCLATSFFNSKSMEESIFILFYFIFSSLLRIASSCFLSHWTPLSNTAVLPAWMWGPIMSTLTVSEACLEGLFSLICHQFSPNNYSCVQSLILPMLPCSLISPGSHQMWTWPAHWGAVGRVKETWADVYQGRAVFLDYCYFQAFNITSKKQVTLGCDFWLLQVYCLLRQEWCLMQKSGTATSCL